MIDLLNNPSLSGTDYVLEGASVRDRFLTAFFLRHNGSLEITVQHAPQMPEQEHPGILVAPFPAAGEESFGLHDESACEPLTLQVIGDWFGSDGDDDM